MSPFTCANKDQPTFQKPCSNPGTKACSNCNLVLYCSKECQTAHWPHHKTSCKHPVRSPDWRPNWEVTDRVPAFMATLGDSGSVSGDRNGSGGRVAKELFGDLPAVDLLKLEGNEGVEWKDDLGILMAASGDIGNLVKTVASLPESYAGDLRVDINDRDATVTTRNLLLLLIALIFDPDEASEIIIHLWYSVALPNKLLKTVRKRILPVLLEVLPESLNRNHGPETKSAPDHQSEPVSESVSGNTITRTWTDPQNTKTTLTATLAPGDWKTLFSYLDKSSTTDFTVASTSYQMVAMDSSRQDHRDRATFRLPPSWRLAKWKFRCLGILLPFGAICEQFNRPNPTFFADKSTCLLHDMADPLDGWCLSEVLESSTSAAKDDIYGHLYLYLKKILGDFCRKLATMTNGLRINLYRMDARDLPAYLTASNGHRTENGKETEMSYDRIDSSTLADPSYLGPKTTLELFAPLLKKKEENPFATLLTVFTSISPTYPASEPGDTVSDPNQTTTQPDPEKQQVGGLKKSISKTLTQKIHRNYLPITRSVLLSTYSGGHNADVLNFMAAHDLLLDRESGFRNFVRRMGLYDGDGVGSVLGLVMKDKRSQGIIRRWELGLEIGDGDGDGEKECSKREFEMLFWSGHSGHECFVEWTRSSDMGGLMECMKNMSMSG